MPKVMMISGLPLAGSFRPPPGRVLNGLGASPMSSRSFMPTVASSGLDVYRAAVRQNLSRAGFRGLGHLGDMLDVCNDPAMAFAQAAATGTAAAFAAFGAPTQQNQPGDRGFQAAAGSVNAANTALANACTAARHAAAAGDPTATATAARLAQLEQLRQQMEGNITSQQTAALMAQQQAAADDQILGIKKTYFWGGLAAIGLGLGAIWYFKKK